MTVLLPRGPGWVTRQGDALVGELSYRPDGKKLVSRTLRAADLDFDSPLTAWFAAAVDGDEVEVFVDVSDGQARRVRMAHPPLVVVPATNPSRIQDADRFGGAANPYTFLPAPPRHDLPPALADGPPPSHGRIDVDAQWSGRLRLRLTAVTPLLLPDPEHRNVNPENDHPTYPVRVGPDGRPLIHGASFKGALRSAYETVTASRFGVFRGRGQPLAYRRPASKQDRPKVTPARVEADGVGGLQFRLCTAVPVPLYDPPEPVPLHDPPDAARPRRKAVIDGDPDAGWGKLHGKQVVADIRTTASGRDVVDRVYLDTPAPGPDQKQGWLSITGRSIGQKSSERLLVPARERPIRVAAEHHAFWEAVLVSYYDAAQYNDPAAVDTRVEIERSRHVDIDAPRPDHARLQEGDLVYLDLDAGRSKVTGVHPVMIGRLPFATAPHDRLDSSLTPAPTLADLSPADRLFGWAAPESTGRRSPSSGYRGRLRVGSITCRTEEWRTDHGPDGVALAPSGTPKPTQFRFYSAADPAGEPVSTKTPKSDAYRGGGGLRGRKTYWHPNNVDDAYWTPGPAGQEAGGRFREWQAHPEAKASQTATHLGWVKTDTEFTAEIFLDAVTGDELAPLLWLARQDGCALRLGAGKPHGFGAVRVEIDWEGTELRTAESLRGCWLDLRRPDPTPQPQVEALADTFENLATTDRHLAPIVAAWRKVAAGLDIPIHYPRTSRQPEAQTYRWFVANERIVNGQTAHGIALPHVLEDDQRLPYLPPSPD